MSKLVLQLLTPSQILFFSYPPCIRFCSTSTPTTLTSTQPPSLTLPSPQLFKMCFSHNLLTFNSPLTVRSTKWEECILKHTFTNIDCVHNNRFSLISIKLNRKFGSVIKLIEKFVVTYNKQKKGSLWHFCHI